MYRRRQNIKSATVSVENRKDLFLLLLYAPGRTKKEGESIRGRTRITKLMFLFSQEFWKKYGFNELVAKNKLPQFVQYRYGPFSQEIFDDIEFFKHVGFIISERSEESFPAELEEAVEFLRQISLFDEDVIEGPSYEAEKFELTPKGLRYAQQLYNSLSSPQKRALIELKTRYGSAPLSTLIRYVYKRYPDYKSIASKRL